MTFSVPNFIRCLNADDVYTASTNQADAVNLFVSDFAQPAGTPFAAAPGFTIPSSNVEACGAVGASVIHSTNQSAPSYGTGKSAVDIDLSPS